MINGYGNLKKQRTRAKNTINGYTCGIGIALSFFPLIYFLSLLQEIFKYDAQMVYIIFLTIMVMVALILVVVSTLGQTFSYILSYLIALIPSMKKLTLMCENELSNAILYIYFLIIAIIIMILLIRIIKKVLYQIKGISIKIGSEIKKSQLDNRLKEKAGIKSSGFDMQKLIQIFKIAILTIGLVLNLAIIVYLIYYIIDMAI